MTGTTRPEMTGDFGMVASTHWLASAAGMHALETGGNAADAAAVAGFVLQVVEPHLNGPGGEVPVLVWDPADEQVHVVAGQGPLPQDASIAHYRGLGLDTVPGSGLLAATVPGAFGAWSALLEHWGTWSIEDALEPAITLAERGWPVLPAVAATIDAVRGLFSDHWPSSAANWLESDGSAPEAWSRKRNPVLAATYRRIQAEARAAGGSRTTRIHAAGRAFYQGFVADAVDEHSRGTFMDSSGSSHAGVLRGADLAAWSPAIETPTSLEFRGHVVHKTGPWAQGPVFLQQLALLDGMGLEEAGHLSPDHVHAVVESAKLAFADREAWYGDPLAVDVPMAELLSAGYTAERRALIGHDADATLRPGSPGGRTPRMPRDAGMQRWLVQEAAAAGTGEPTLGPAGGRGPAPLGRRPAPGSTTDGFVAPNGAVRGDTCHLDVIDRSGLTISATPSGGWLASSPTVPSLGFCLNSRAQMTWLEPDLASSLRPGTRPRTTLSPTLVTRDGRPLLAFGTPGGDQQDQWTLQFLLAHLVFGLDLQAAIDAPTFHTTHLAESFWPRLGVDRGVVVEAGLGEQTLAALAARGHRLTVVPPSSLGRVTTVGVAPGTGFLRGAADSRGGQAYVAGR